MTFGDILGVPFEWLFRREALRAARAALAGADEACDAAALRQAGLVLEVARRASGSDGETAEPSGRAAALSLYRQAAGWARAARRDRAASGAHAAGAREQPAPPATDVSDDDVARARDDAEALVMDLDAPRRRIERLLYQRWSRLALLAAAALSLALAARIWAVGPDLADGRPLRLSSTWSGWSSCVRDNHCKGLMLHTETEDNPWAEIDLGAPRTVRRIDVVNRDDCCWDRATPLVAEVSDDRAAWSEVARCDHDFGSWTARFPPRTARYVRLRVPRRTTLHLSAIAVR
jgi:N-acetylgalactosamine 4-sulfate 6-O-sulfotransferase